DLGRGLQHQGRRAWPRLCRGLAGPADRTSRYQPGVAQYRYVQAGAGAGGARRAAGARRTGRTGDAGSPGRIGWAPGGASVTATRIAAAEDDGHGTPRGFPAGRVEHPGPGGADRLRADHAPALADVRRIAGAGSLRLALRGATAAPGRASGRVDLRRAV